MKILTKIFFCFFFLGCGISPFNNKDNELTIKSQFKNKENIEKTTSKVEKALEKLKIKVQKKEKYKNKVFIETKNFKIILEERKEETNLNLKPKILGGNKKEFESFKKEIEKQIDSIIY